MAALTLVVTPTYNEAENVSDLIGRIHDACPQAHVLVVDDNSPDGTHRIVEEMGKADPRVHLLKRPGKAGLAAAYIEGLQWGVSRNYAHLVQMDADLSHPPEVIPRLLESLKWADVAIGSRYVKGGGVENWSFFRRLVSWCGNLYARVVLGIPVRDLTGGFVAWRRQALELVGPAGVSSKGYAFLIELKYRAWRNKLKHREVPFVFPDRTRGQSKMSALIFREAALAVLRLRFTPFPKTKSGSDSERSAS